MQQTAGRSAEMCLANCAMTKNVLEKYVASEILYLHNPFRTTPATPLNDAHPGGFLFLATRTFSGQGGTDAF